jgi:hypothetical protein
MFTRRSTTGFGAILNLLPIALPLFTPGEGALAVNAGFLRQMLFFHEVVFS